MDHTWPHVDEEENEMEISLGQLKEWEEDKIETSMSSSSMDISGVLLRNLFIDVECS